MFNSNCASVPLVANVDGGNGNGMFGNDSWIGLIIILALLSGNFGGFGGFGGGNGGVANEVQRGFDNQSVLNKLNGLENGLCDGFYSQNTTMLQGFNGLQQTAMNGFHGVDNAICTLGYQNQQGFNSLAHQMSDCCCTTQRAIDGVNYNLATQSCDTRNTIQNATRDIIDNQNCNTRSILDFLVNDKLATLQAENQNLKLQASQAAQNAYLLNELKPCPTPAYITCNPFTGQYGGYGYNSCGCA